MKNKTLYLIITIMLNIIFGCVSFIGLMYGLMLNIISNEYLYIALLFLIVFVVILINYLILKLFNKSSSISKYNILIPSAVFIIFQFLLFFILCQI